MSATRLIEQKLTEAFSPEHLHVIDDSWRHAGHSGNPSTHQEATHLRIVIVSPQFANMDLLSRHRAVHQVLKDEMASFIHAMELKLLAPGEPIPTLA